VTAGEDTVRPVAAEPGGVEAPWWVGAILAVVTFGIGVALLVWPELSVGAFALLVGSYLILLGVTRFLMAFARDEASGSRVLSAMLGILAVLLGVASLRNLVQTVAVLVVLLGLFWLMHGFMRLFVGYVEKEMPGRGVVMLSGVLSMAAGVVLLAWPEATLTVMIWATGIWLIALSGLELALALAIRRHAAGPR
jgi:uncharacterized membrane protein HdeD (DUF308 family)